MRVLKHSGWVVILLMAVVLCHATSYGSARMHHDTPDSLRRTYRQSEAVQRFAIYRDTVAAREIWHELVAEDADYAPALYYLSLTMPWTEEGATYARRAFEADSTNKWYVQNYGHTLLGTRQYDKALPVYRRLMSLDNSDPSTYYFLALLYDANDMPYSAIAILDSAEMRMSYNEQMINLKQDMLMRTMQFDRVIEEGRAIIAERPYDSRMHLRLAGAYEMLGRDSLARDTYEKAYRIDTTNLETIVELAEYHNRKGNYAEMFSYEELLFADDRLSAEDKLRRLRQYTSNKHFYRDNFFNIGKITMALVVAYPENREVINEYALHLMAMGNRDEALAFLRRHLDDEGATAEEYIRVIQLEYMLDRKELIRQDLERGMARFDDNIELMSFAGFIASEEGDYDTAIDIFRRTLRMAQDDEERSTLWGYIGDTYYAANDLKRTFKAYDKALAYNKDNTLVLNNYAYFTALINKALERALDMSSRAIYLESNNPTYLDTHAWVLHRLGRHNEAKRIMQQALSLDGQYDADLLAHYGDILWALGEKFMAETYWKKAVERGYDNEAMERHIEELKSQQ